MASFVSQYNFERGARAPDLPEKVTVFDTTLRDGEQTPGVALSPAEKIHIAEQLAKLGVDIIEAGFPINSQTEQNTIKQIQEMGLKSKICGLARAVDADIECAINCKVDIVHTFISTSDIHIKHQMNSTREAVKKSAINAVKKIKERGVKCIFSPMDATRTDFDFLIDVCKAVEEAGADTINIPDTVGVMNPRAIGQLFGRIRREIKTPLDVHCHNDFGLAVANTLAAVEAGASQVQVTINGLGERAGNADLSQTVMALEILYGVKTNINSRLLTETSKLIERFTMINLPPNTPLVGKNAFTHESGIHAAAILKNASTFEPLSADLVGQRSRVVLGKNTGKHAVENTLHAMGYKLTPDQLAQVTQRIKELAIKQKKMSEDDLIAIADDVIGKLPDKETLIKLDEFSVFTSNKMRTVANVVIELNGKKNIGSGTGVGAVDAAYHAICSAASMPIKLTEYNLKAITGGTDALAHVLIRIEDDKKNEYQADSVHEDIVLASVNALIKSMNKMAISRSGGRADG